MSIRDPREADLYCLDYRRDGLMLAASGKSTEVNVYDEATKSLVVSFKSEGMMSLGHSNRVCGLRFAYDPNLIVSGGWDNTIFFWDVRESKCVGWVHGPQIAGDAIDIRNDIMVTGSNNYKDPLQLWSVSERKLIENVKLNPEGGSADMLGYLYTAAFNRSEGGYDFIAAGGGGLNEIRILSQKQDHPLIGKVAFTKPVTSCDFAYNSNMLAVACSDGLVRVYAIEKAIKSAK